MTFTSNLFNLYITEKAFIILLAAAICIVAAVMAYKAVKRMSGETHCAAKSEKTKTEFPKKKNTAKKETKKDTKKETQKNA